MTNSNTEYIHTNAHDTVPVNVPVSIETERMAYASDFVQFEEMLLAREEERKQELAEQAASLGIGQVAEIA